MSESSSKTHKVGDILTLNLDDLKPNPEQVRKHFDEESIAVLAESIAEDGLLQNIAVTEYNGELIIVAGERRVRALRHLKEQGRPVPELFGRYVEGSLRKLAFVENMFREDMTAVEFAESALALSKDKSEGKELTQGALGKLLGLKRTTVNGIISIAKMDEDIKKLVRDKPNATRDSLERISRIKGINRQRKAIDTLLKELEEKEKQENDDSKASKKLRESKRTKGRMAADALTAYSKTLDRFATPEFAVQYAPEDRDLIASCLSEMKEKIETTIKTMELNKGDWDKQYLDKKQEAKSSKRHPQKVKEKKAAGKAEKKAQAKQAAPKKQNDKSQGKASGKAE